MASVEVDHRMSDTTGRGWLARNYAAILAFILVLAVTIVAFIYRERLEALGNYGYVGAFLIALIGNATIVLPMPAVLLIFPLATTLNPLLIGIVSGIGGTIGETTAYLAGYSGSAVVKNIPLYRSAERWLKRWGPPVIFVFSSTVLPMDIMGLVCGTLRYPYWKFFLAGGLGKTAKYIVLSYAAYFGWQFLLEGTITSVPGLISISLVAFMLLLAIVFYIWRRRQRTLS